MSQYENCLGFGKYKNIKISEFGVEETEYLIWVLKNVRLPTLLWETVVSFLDTKVIIDTKSCIEDFNDLDEVEKLYIENEKLNPESIFFINVSEFLESRIEPNVKYFCNNCKTKTFGIPSRYKIPNLIKCSSCLEVLELPDIELRFYFGWYNGWRIMDFETTIDKEYLRWILENLEHLTPQFKNGIELKLEL